MSEGLKFDLPQIKTDLIRGIKECNLRGLIHSSKWLSELNFSLQIPSFDASNIDADSYSGISQDEYDSYFIAKSYFDTREYDRAAYFVRNCLSPVPRFLYFYSMYMAKEKKRLDNSPDNSTLTGSAQLKDLSELMSVLNEEYNHKNLDGYGLFLYGIILKKLDLTKMAISVLLESVHLVPINWSADNSTLTGSAQLKDLSELMSVLNEEYNHKNLDGYGLFLYGIILKKLDLTKMAISVLLESVHLVPINWSAWLELSPLIQDTEHFRGLTLPKHWIKSFFIGHTFIEIFVNEAGISLFEEIQNAGFEKSVYASSQIAIAYHNKRDVDRAIQMFQQIQSVDPYRLENMDMYSNLLFVREQKTEMAHLAHKAVEINKYRPETCCVIGNYYSIRGEHQKAILYFQRALKLNPKYLSAWTLMGHEFMELKNTNAAIQSYRQAVEVNRRDFRAWYGLGQAYEIIKMPVYALYYYKTATQLRPYDSRMLLALGEIYEKLDKKSNALKCYQKACNVGDIEGFAMLKLGNLYEKMGDQENAVNSYKNYANDERSTSEKASLITAYLYLANYYAEKKNYDEASHYAHKVLELDETKQEAKAILKRVSNDRAKPENEEEDMTEAIMDLEPEPDILQNETSGEDMDMSLA